MAPESLNYAVSKDFNKSLEQSQQTLKSNWLEGGMKAREE